MAPVSLVWGIGWVVAGFKSRRHPSKTPGSLRDANTAGFHILINAIETTFKKGLVEPEKAKEAEENYNKFKDEYKVTLCKARGTMRPGISWTPKDVLTMAKEVGLTDFIVPAYYLPMQHAHPKVKGMLERVVKNAEGRFVPAERFQPLLSDRVLCAAHALVLHALDVQVKHFGLDDAALKQANDDFVEIWKSRTDLNTKGLIPEPTTWLEVVAGVGHTSELTALVPEDCPRFVRELMPTGSNCHQQHAGKST